MKLVIFIYLPIGDEFEWALNREDGCEDVVKISQGLKKNFFTPTVWKTILQTITKFPSPSHIKVHQYEINRPITEAHSKLSIWEK